MRFSEGKTTTHRDSVYLEYFDANLPLTIPQMVPGVRIDQWKLNLYDKHGLPPCCTIQPLVELPGGVVLLTKTVWRGKRRENRNAVKDRP